MRIKTKIEKRIEDLMAELTMWQKERRGSIELNGGSQDGGDYDGEIQRMNMTCAHLSIKIRELKWVIKEMEKALGNDAPKGGAEGRFIALTASGKARAKF